MAKKTKSASGLDQEVFARYAKLKVKEKEIQAEIKELVPVVIGEMETAGIDKIPSDIGSFVLAARKKWKFSAKVEEAEQTVEELKEQEKADGTAEFEETKELKFFAKKDQ